MKHWGINGTRAAGAARLANREMNLATNEKAAWLLPTLAAIAAALAACHRDAPRAASDTPDPGPAPEEFCQQVDRLSEEDLSDATPDERRAAHAVCVQASTEDRARFREWGPCARCTMEVSSLEELDARCHAICATLEAKMAQEGGDAATD